MVKEKKRSEVSESKGIYSRDWESYGNTKAGPATLEKLGMRMLTLSLEEKRPLCCALDARLNRKSQSLCRFFSIDSHKDFI